MKIAVFHNLPPGGAKRVVYEQIKALAEKHDVDLFEYSGADRSFMDPSRFVNECRYYSLPKGIRQGRLKRDYFDFFSLKKVHKKIASDVQKSKCDIALIHPDKFTQSPYLLKYLKIPSVYYCEEYLRIAYEKELSFTEQVGFSKKKYELISRKIRKHIDRTNAKQATKIFVNSNFMQARINKAYSVNSETLYLGVDETIFKRQKVKRQKQLLFVGAKDMISGYEFIKKIEPHVNKLDIRIKQIDFVKGQLRLSDKDLAKEYSKSLATLCISYNEPFGLTSIESLACETPVLAVNEGGYRESVVNTKSGYLLPRDISEFIEKIRFLVEDRDRVDKMGIWGRKYVAQHFNWKKHNQLLEKKLIKLCKE